MTKVANSRFQAGQSGNPSGRPKVQQEFVAQMRENAPAAIAALVGGLKDPKKFDTCAGLILAYAFGKPKLLVELSGEDGGLIGLEVIKRVIVDPGDRNT